MACFWWQVNLVMFIKHVATAWLIRFVAGVVPGKALV
jgi:hypothetical protein